MHRSALEGNIHTYDELIPIDYDELTEKAEQEAKHGIENRIRKEAEESKTVADFKARTEELFHGINGQTQEEKQTDRISIKEKLAEKKAVIEQRDKSEKEVSEKGTEKNQGGRYKLWINLQWEKSI